MRQSLRNTAASGSQNDKVGLRATKTQTFQVTGREGLWQHTDTRALERESGVEPFSRALTVPPSRSRISGPIRVCRLNVCAAADAHEGWWRPWKLPRGSSGLKGRRLSQYALVQCYADSVLRGKERALLTLDRRHPV